MITIIYKVHKSFIYIKDLLNLLCSTLKDLFKDKRFILKEKYYEHLQSNKNISNIQIPMSFGNT